MRFEEEITMLLSWEKFDRVYVYRANPGWIWKYEKICLILSHNTNISSDLLNIGWNYAISFCCVKLNRKICAMLKKKISSQKRKENSRKWNFKDLEKICWNFVFSTLYIYIYIYNIKMFLYTCTVIIYKSVGVVFFSWISFEFKILINVSRLEYLKEILLKISTNDGEIWEY